SASFYDSQGQRLFYREFDARETNNGFADHADYDRSHSFLANLSYREFRLQAVLSSREKGLPTGSYGTVFNDPRINTVDAKAYVDLGYQHTFSNTLDITGRLFYDRTDFDGNYVADYSGTGILPFIDNKVVSHGRVGGLELNASKTAEKHRVTAGVEYRNNLRQDQASFDAV